MRLRIALFLLVPQFFSAQAISPVLLQQQELLAETFVGADKYGNLYTTTQRVFYKISEKKTFQFSDLQLGPISSVDLINPLRITVFYDQFNTAVILDNTLNEITRIDFNQNGDFKNISHARTASDRRLWIFNVDLQQLELYDYQSKRVVAISPPFSDTATAMTSNFNTCYVFTRNGLKVFNNYGSLLKTVPVSEVSQAFLNKETLLVQQDKKILLLPEGVLDFKDVNLVEKQFKQLFYANEILYIYDGAFLRTYTLKLSKN